MRTSEAEIVPTAMSHPHLPRDIMVARDTQFQSSFSTWLLKWVVMEITPSSREKSVTGLCSDSKFSELKHMDYDVLLCEDRSKLQPFLGRLNDGVCL